MVKNLKKLRLEKNLSQQQLGEIIGFSQQAVYKYETQRIEPDIATLIKLADFFNTSVDFLIGNTDIQHKISNIESYSLNGDETTIMQNFRKLSPCEKESIALIINNYLNKK